MKTDGVFAARVALLAALAYVAALASIYIPNVSLSFIVIFASGAVFGITTGMAVGGIGEFLWTVFNPLGMASLPVTIAQVVAMMLVGGIGAIVQRRAIMIKTAPLGFAVFALLGLTCGAVFQLILNGVDTLLYGQSWKYLMAGLGFSLATIVSNAVIFSVCYPMVVRLAARERMR